MSNSIGIRLSFAKKTLLTAAALFALGVPIVVGSMTSALRLEPPSAVSAVIQSVEFAKPQPVKSPIMESPRVTSQQSDKPQAPPPPAATAVPQFEEASIRPCDLNSLPPVPEGSRGGGANSFQMTPGRTHALCMTLATLIRTAYNYSPAEIEILMGRGAGSRGLALNNVYGLGVEDGVRVRGGPDWVRKDRYTIEAVAQGPSDAATMQGPMLRELLERRFQLKIHTETEQVPAFALVVAKGGIKIKPMQEAECEPLPPRTPGVPNLVRPHSFAEVRRGAKPSCGTFGAARNGPNSVLVAGGSTLSSLALLGGSLGAQVLDKTGITDKFNFILEFAVDENTRGGVIPPPLSDTEPSDIPLGPTIFTALEQQLGLRLEPTKAPREFVVIDRVEKPSPN